MSRVSKPRVRILPYKQGSRSAKSLAAGTGGKVLKLQGSNFAQKPSDLVVNWGRSDLTGNYSVLNPPDKVVLASDKLKLLTHLKEAGVSCIPKFWTKKEDIPNEEFPIVCRKILRGHSGVGIHIADTPADLVDAPLYVKYVKKAEEYRVHLGKPSKVIAVQKKVRRSGVDNPNWKVRNLDNGFIYQRHGFECPARVLEAAHDAFTSSGLDFGAVDVIWNTHYQQAVVLEINTAPGLEGSTVEDYANYFKGVMGDD